VILSLKLPAGPHELFSHDAADNMVGQTFTSDDNGILGIGSVVAASVVEYGRAIQLTVEWPNPVVWAHRG